MVRAAVSGLLALSLSSVLAGCGPDKPRALVVADGSGTVHAIGVDARVKLFQKKTGRQVRILVVEPTQAVTLASRGEADVAVVPTTTALDVFIASEHGRVAGLMNHNGDRLKVLEVNAAQHPKVDGQGARMLASALIAPP